MSIWHSQVIWEEGILIEKMSPALLAFEWAFWQGCGAIFWLMITEGWEGQLTVGRVLKILGAIKKAGRTSHGQQASKLHAFMSSALAPMSTYHLIWVPFLSSVSDGLGWNKLFIFGLAILSQQ